MLRDHRPKNATIYMACASVHENLSEQFFSKDQCALEVIPELWKMAIDNILSVEHYDHLMAVIKKVSALTEAEQRKFLQQSGNFKDSPNSETEGKKAKGKRLNNSFEDLLRNQPKSPGIAEEARIVENPDLMTDLPPPQLPTRSKAFLDLTPKAKAQIDEIARYKGRWHTERIAHRLLLFRSNNKEAKVRKVLMNSIRSSSRIYIKLR
jgi:hypothetical protein